MVLQLKRKSMAKGAFVLTLALAPACASTQMAGQQLDDTTVSSRVGRRLTADPDIRRYRIDVDTVNQVVTLRGTVESEADRQEAERIAANTEGVLRVVNQLDVSSADFGERTQEGFSDGGLKTKVGTKLAADPDVRRYQIDVDVNDRIVYLSGIVGDQVAKEQAGQLAASVDGVSDVVNELQVESNVEPGEPQGAAESDMAGSDAPEEKPREGSEPQN